MLILILFETTSDKKGSHNTNSSDISVTIYIMFVLLIFYNRWTTEMQERSPARQGAVYTKYWSVE